MLYHIWLKYKSLNIYINGCYSMIVGERMDDLCRRFFYFYYLVSSWWVCGKEWVCCCLYEWMCVCAHAHVCSMWPLYIYSYFQNVPSSLSWANKHKNTQLALQSWLLQLESSDWLQDWWQERKVFSVVSSKEDESFYLLFSYSQGHSCYRLGLKWFDCDLKVTYRLWYEWETYQIMIWFVSYQNSWASENN